MLFLVKIFDAQESIAPLEGRLRAAAQQNKS